MDILVSAGAFALGGVCGTIVAAFVLYSLYRSKLEEREAWWYGEQERIARLTRWREEAIRRGHVHELSIKESSAVLVPKLQKVGK